MREKIVRCNNLGIVLDTSHKSMKILLDGKTDMEIFHLLLQDNPNSQL